MPGPLRGMVSKKQKSQPKGHVRVPDASGGSWSFTEAKSKATDQ